MHIVKTFLGHHPFLMWGFLPLRLLLLMSHLFRMPLIPSLFLVFNLPPLFGLSSSVTSSILSSFPPLLSLSSEDRLFTPSLVCFGCFLCVSLPSHSSRPIHLFFLSPFAPSTQPTHLCPTVSQMAPVKKLLPAFFSFPECRLCQALQLLVMNPCSAWPGPRTSWLLQAGRVGAGVGREEGIMIGKEKD